MAKRTNPINWPEVKRDYVEGITGEDDTLVYPSYEVVAERHGINGSNLRMRGADEHWTDQRAAFQQQAELARRNARAAALAKHGIELDTTAVDIARAALAVVAQRLNEIGTNAALRQQAGQRQDRDITIPPPADHAELRGLAATATQLYHLGREAIGDVPELNLNVEGEVTITDDRDLLDRAELILGVLVEADALPGAPRELLEGTAAETDPADDPEAH